MPSISATSDKPRLEPDGLEDSAFAETRFDLACPPPPTFDVEIHVQRTGSGEAAWMSLACPGKESGNEDTVGVISLSPERSLLAVADGLGGHRGGRRASQLIVSSLHKAARQVAVPPRPGPLMISGAVPVPCRVREQVPASPDPRQAILDQIERVNRRLLRNGVGAGTTLALVETDENRVRTYHIGDSEILVLSQRGRIKYQTVSHSPVGYAVKAGVLSEAEALLHNDRHLVSNVVGSPEMSVELGPWINLAPRDTVLLASDGLFDNLTLPEIVEQIRKGALAKSVRELAELAWQRMTRYGLELPSKPDDLSILAFRRTSPPSPRSDGNHHGSSTT